MGGGELVLLALAHGLLLLPCASAVDRGQFPDNFLFGASTPAYQVQFSSMRRAEPCVEIGRKWGLDSC
ncbi:hypothetical protein SEVIR_7G173101v4 [Setaria viridis]